jgi:hypothetical protein
VDPLPHLEGKKMMLKIKTPLENKESLHTQVVQEAFHQKDLNLPNFKMPINKLLQSVRKAMEV